MLATILERYQVFVEKALVLSLHNFGPQTVLRSAVEYALKNGGKRFRPAIVYMVADALGKNVHVDHAAVAVELFHTASLIADDLPCMDNDDERRQKPSLHKAYGEATAILASYALIAAGYDHIRLGLRNRPEACAAAIENASFNTGILGATGGQFEDLFSDALTEASVLDVIDKKTSTLFEISFVFGWLCGEGDLASLDLVKKTARSFGRAFQISDDLQDFEQDVGKLNFARVAGKEKAHALLAHELANYYSGLNKLKIPTDDLLTLGQFVEQAVK